MELQSLKVKTREAGHKGRTHQLRQSGLVPCVLYGGSGESVALALDGHEFGLMVHGRAGEHAVVQLDVEDNPSLSSPALLKEVQHDPIRGDITHADFLRIRLDERIVTVVPLRLVGQPVGVINGGVLDQQLREVEVECLALEMPEELTADVSGLELGDNLHVADVAVPEGVTVLTADDRAVATVLAPRVLKEEAEEGEEGEGEGEEAAAPEVIGEKKEEE